MPDLAQFSQAGEAETVRYHFLAPLLLNEVQKQQRLIEAQAAMVKQQTERIAMLEKETARIAALEQQVAKVATLEQLTAKMAATLDQLQRNGGMTTAGLPLK